MNNILDEYRTITEGAIWHERREFGRFRVDGSDRRAFLQALVSNDLAALEPGAGIYATYLTPQGRMLADLRLYAQRDHMLCVAPADATESLVSRLNDLIFAEDVRVTDVSSDVAQIFVVGHLAASRVARALQLDADVLAGLAPLTHVAIDDGFVARSDDASVPGFELFLNTVDHDRAIAALSAAGVAPASDAIVDALRIEAARPAFGRDMSTDTIPLEAGLLDRAISTTKGCYVGQEIIIRVLHRGGGRVARRLVQLAADDPGAAAPPAGAEIIVDGRDAGRVTSAAFSPRLGRAIALGYVPRAAALPGTRVTISFDGQSLPAEITALAG